MSEIVERVAAAILKKHQDFSKVGWAHYLELAEVAIAAMREPTDAMEKAGVIRCHGVHMGDGSAPVCAQFLGDGAHAAWQRMIDAALAEPKKILPHDDT